MKFTAVLLALATAAIAAPTANTELDTRGNRDSCDDYGKNHGKNYGNNWDNDNYGNDHGKGHGKGYGNVDKYRQRHGHGRHHGKQEYCDNWVPVDKNLIALDITADICINLNVAGLINVDIDLDVEVDVDLLRQNYPTYQSLYCCPDKKCQKGKKVRKESCWEHEFDGKYKNRNGGKY